MVFRGFFAISSVISSLVAILGCADMQMEARGAESYSIADFKARMLGNQKLSGIYEESLKG